MTGSMTRTHPRRTVSLSPEADEALVLLMGMFDEKAASRVMDRLLRAEMARRGFTIRQAEEPAMQLDLITRSMTLPSTHHIDKRYVKAEPGESFQILLRNPTAKRKMVILTVDGLNTADGKPASYTGSGWLVPAFGRITIQGWKLDGENAAAFTFGDKSRSYASQSGQDTRNLGVVGAAVFDEKVQAPVPNHWESLGGQPKGGGQWSMGSTPRSASYGDMSKGSRAHGQAMMDSVGSTMDSMQLDSSRSGDAAVKTSSGLLRSASVGTEFGKKVTMKTTNVQFVKASDTPSEIVLIHYGTAEDLVAWGVPLPAASPTPNAFPGEGCAPPAGWQG
jgi:hypothetical protein